MRSACKRTIAAEKDKKIKIFSKIYDTENIKRKKCDFNKIERC